MVGYYSTSDPWNPEVKRKDNIEGDLSISRIGTTITEGQGAGGTFRETLTNAMRLGVRRVELALQAAGSQPRTGAESYGKALRQDIKDMAKVNKIKIHSVHSPVQVGNLSGLGSRGFSEEEREAELNEVKKAIDFAADVSEGGTSIVVHTGEFPRNISDVNAYEKNGIKFEAYPGEEEKKIFSLVDERTGQVIKSIRKDIPMTIPEWKKNSKGEYVDENGNPISDINDMVPETDENGVVKFKEANWNDIEKETRSYNMLLDRMRKEGKDIPFKKTHISPAEYAYFSTLDAQEKSAQGWADYHRANAIQEKKELDNLRNIPESEMNEEMKARKRQLEARVRSSMETAMGQEMQAQEIRNVKRHIIPVDEYAKEKSFSSLAELGIFAYQEEKKKGLKEPIFIAPENIFPEMGYGSHPNELVEMVEKSREKMVELLTKKKIPDPSSIGKNGARVEMDNPYYQEGMSEEEARRIAKEHIKATFDTQHLGMWFRYFNKEGKQFNSEEEKMEEFNKWYEDWVEKMQKNEIIGNVHMVDGSGRGHSHLPIGQGELPVKTAIHKLIELGYEGNISSEGHTEGNIRQIVQAWNELGSPIYGAELGYGGRGRVNNWTDIQNSYFDKIQTPYFVVGSYAPSDEWKLWSETPLE
ncbi:MAG: hypothetical protein PWQ28_439 [Candidatus Woesearchaeota archaeon]|nr:hypothetical protein [Candidatus Woesearchaeota archaeon]